MEGLNIEGLATLLIIKKIIIIDNNSVQSTVINGVLLTKKNVKRKYALG